MKNWITEATGIKTEIANKPFNRVEGELPIQVHYCQIYALKQIIDGALAVCDTFLKEHPFSYDTCKFSSQEHKIYNTRESLISDMNRTKGFWERC